MLKKQRQSKKKLKALRYYRGLTLKFVHLKQLEII